jgi:hypothetical protein
MHRIHGLLLLIAVSCQALPGDALAADGPCPDDHAITGTYRNHSYGFTVVIPKGLEGWWNSAVCVPQPPNGCTCMGDHGRDIPLRGGGQISIDAAPELFDETLATAAYKDLRRFELHTNETALLVKTLGPMRLRGMPSYRCIAASTQAGAPVVREVVHVTLPSGTYVAISIEAPEQQFREHHRAYEALLNSLRPSP